MRRAARIALLSSLGVIAFACDALAADPAAATQCTTPKTQCVGSDGYYASSDDLARVTAVTDPLLKELRTCLDGVGGKHITPTVIVRWDSDGTAVSVKIDAPGYESQACVTKISAKLQALQNPHETAIRCEYGCNKPATAAPATPPPSTPPVVVPPPVPTTETTPPTTTPATPEKKQDFHTEKVWYGVQTLVPDAISFALLVASIPAKSGALAGIGYVSFLLATPIVHFAHGNIGPGFGSLALRVVLPWLMVLPGVLVGVIAGSSTGSGDVGKIGDGATGGVVGGVVGFGVGMIGCALIDAAALAYTKERMPGPPPPTAQELRRQKQWYTLAPTFDVNKDRASLGVHGTF